MPLDKDLQSIQEVRELLTKAKEAQLAFRAYSQEQVDKIVQVDGRCRFRGCRTPRANGV